MQVTKINVKLSGLSDIMFDRFIDHSKEIRPPEQKLYLIEKNRVIMPAENIYSFLFGDKVPGCVKTIEAKKSKPYMQHQSFVSIDPAVVPFVDDKNKEIKFDGFGKGKKFWIHEGSPVVKSSGGQIVKQELKKRPTMKLPWNLKFQIMLIKNDAINEEKLFNWFTSGGLIIAIGTYRPRFGRFAVDKWSVSGNK